MPSPPSIVASVMDLQQMQALTIRDWEARLCAGKTDFSQTGGTTELKKIVLLETNDFASTCTQDYFTTQYLPKYYPDADLSPANPVEKTGPSKERS